MLWTRKLALKIPPFLQVGLQSVAVLCSCRGWVRLGACDGVGWGCSHCARNGTRLAQPPTPLESLVLIAPKSPLITGNVILSWWD